MIDENDVVVPLSSAEFRLLTIFIDHPQQVVTRDFILDYLADKNLNVYDRTVDAQVIPLRLNRRDTCPNHSMITTMPGDCYILTSSVRYG